MFYYALSAWLKYLILVEAKVDAQYRLMCLFLITSNILGKLDNLLEKRYVYIRLLEKQVDVSFPPSHISRKIYR